jgi:sugar lactone lactonase YvrE
VKTLQSSVVADGLLYGEGARWHDGRLWVADQPAGRVFTVADDGELTVVAETSHPSGLGWTPDDRLLISTIREPFIKRVDRDGVVVVHDLGHLGTSLNDMVVGPDGRAYVDLYPDGPTGPTPGAIVLVAPEGDARIVADGLGIPNGMAITPDGSTLLASVTLESVIFAFTILADGSLTDRRVFADLGQDARPDGLCVDEEGAVWVGNFAAGEYLRLREGGEVTHRIETPGRWAVAVALGGADRRTLYLVTNAPEFGTSIERGETRGRIEAARVDVPGAGWP